jgi:uncharacterized protein YggU (UPF0235/DUF167 family)
LRAAADGVLVHVLATSKASSNGVEGAVTTAHGAALKVCATAAPDSNKAIQAIIKVLAKAWHLPPSRLSIVAGNTDRHKTILVAGDSDPLITRLQQWLGDAA